MRISAASDDDEDDDDDVRAWDGGGAGVGSVATPTPGQIEQTTSRFLSRKQNRKKAAKCAQ